MNGNLKRPIVGFVFLFLIFCIAIIINTVLDRSGDDSIIVSQSQENVTEETSENVVSESTTSGGNGETDGLNGYAEYKKQNGDTYKGEWKDGNYNGQGVLNRKTGEVYDGQWIDGAFDNGKITYKVNNYGGTRTVNIENSEKTGEGKYALILETGEIYDGQWLNGKKNGTGTLYTRGSNGTMTKIKTGIWDEDILVDGTETSLYDDGLRTYVVDIKDGFRDGVGVLYDAKGNELEREQWKDDEPIE